MTEFDYKVKRRRKSFKDFFIDKKINIGKTESSLLKINFYVLLFLILMLACYVVLLYTKGEDMIAFIDHLSQSVINQGTTIYTITILLGFIVTFFLLIPNKIGGHILGRKHAKATQNYFTWIAQIFCIGAGASIVYNVIYSPINYIETPFFYDYSSSSIRRGVMTSMFHNGINVWIFYFMAALPLAYYFHSKDLPLAPRTLFYPLLKEKVFGRFGDIIDAFVIIIIFFTVATSLTFNINSFSIIFENVTGFHFSVFLQIFTVFIVCFSMGIALMLGYQKSLPIISIIALTMLFLIYFIFDSTSENFGTYTNTYKTIEGFLRGDVSTLIGLNDFKVHFESFITNETIYNFASWCSWSLLVGLFVAKISYGRTVRELFVAVVFVPSAISACGFIVFGSLYEQLIFENSIDAIALITSANTAIDFLANQYISNGILNSIIIFCFYVIALFINILVFANYIITTNSLIVPRKVVKGNNTALVTISITGIFIFILIYFSGIYGIEYIENSLIILSVPTAIFLTSGIVMFVYQVISDYLYTYVYLEKIEKEKREQLVREYEKEYLTVEITTVDDGFKDIKDLIFSEDDNITKRNIIYDENKNIKSLEKNNTNNFIEKDFNLEDYENFEFE